MIPDNNLSANIDTIKRITNQGTKVGSDILLEFSFSGTQSDLNKVKVILQNEGFHHDEKISSADSFIFTKTVKLVVDEINSLDEKLYLLADQFDLEYEGWGHMSD